MQEVSTLEDIYQDNNARSLNTGHLALACNGCFNSGEMWQIVFGLKHDHLTAYLNIFFLFF